MRFQRVGKERTPAQEEKRRRSLRRGGKERQVFT